MKLLPFLQLIRPRQWVKNFFVAAPLLFGLKLFDLESLSKVCLGFIIFCLLASSIYILNDLCDIEADRNHHKNKNRPLASGTLRIQHAFIMLGILMGMLCILIAVTLQNNFITKDFYFIACLYFVINLGYSFGLKHIALFEMFLVAMGYILRVIAGCILVAVSPSPWILVVTFVAAMLIVSGKRRAEIVHTHEHKTPGRKSIAKYNLAFLDSMIAIFGTSSIITYMLYTLSPEAMILHHTPYLIYTSIFVMFGVTRYILLIKMHKDAESPTDLITSDWGICATVILWVISLILIFYVK